jgi:hypothetical protein
VDVGSNGQTWSRRENPGSKLSRAEQRKADISDDNVDVKMFFVILSPLIGLRNDEPQHKGFAEEDIRLLDFLVPLRYNNKE